jgi:predicted CXXCH cytochrome family protein
MICHEDPDLATEDQKSLYVDAVKYKSSIHGELGFSCVDCHVDLRDVEDFPHAEKLLPVSCRMCHEEAFEEFQKSVHSQATPEEDCCDVSCKDCHGTHDIKGKEDYDSWIFPLNLPRTCETCHLEKVQTERGGEFIKRYEESIHYEGLEKAGLATSSNCSNCHGAHDVRHVHDPDSRVSRNNIIRTCGKCHVGIERDYLEGVHGQDYTKGLTDIPVCTDCHSEHEIESPQDLSSRVYATKVAEVCSRCHDDEALSRQYGFITARLKTYTSSFHGTASRFGETRVANCASCHGFHDIRPSSDPKSMIHPDNLPETCGNCHPGAGENFAKGKIHVVSEKATNKWAYFVKTFYIILIIGIVFVFLAFISVDIMHRVILRRKKV